MQRSGRHTHALPWNARTHANPQVEQIITSADWLQQPNPCHPKECVSPDTAALLAARSMGMEEVQTIERTGLNDAQQERCGQKFALAASSA